MTKVYDGDIQQAAEQFANEWNEASGTASANEARMIASAIEVAGLRITAALQDVSHELSQLPRG